MPEKLRDHNDRDHNDHFFANQLYSPENKLTNSVYDCKNTVYEWEQKSRFMPIMLFLVKY